MLADTAEASDGKNGTHNERYPLVVFDFERVEFPFVICIWVLIASLAKIAFHLNSQLPKVVPESCLLIALGLVVGCVLHFTKVARTSEYVLDANIFFIYLLPPIIFDAGYFMPSRSFFDNIGSVLLMAVVNTAFNTVCIGVALWAVSLWGWIGRDISLLHCLIFSALISAVDPVAVISVFEEVHVNQMLYIIVFGESLLNDGVTVVLYHMMEGFIELGEDNIIPIDVVTGIGSFFIIAIGGTLIGVLFGFFGGFITKYTDHVKVIEPLFVFVLGYLMYLTSEMMHLSGILGCWNRIKRVFANSLDPDETLQNVASHQDPNFYPLAGSFLRHYMEHNLSKKTAVTVKYFMKMLANISETIIFMFLGLSTIVDTLDWNLAFIFFALFFCLVFRILGVMILAWCLNQRRLIKLTFVDQFIMAYGGLRGGIAFCLALSLDEKLVPEKSLFITATIMIVFFTVFVQGISIKPVVNALKVKRQPENNPSLNEKIHETLLDHLMAGIEDLTSRSSHNLMRTKFRRFNSKYLQPMLCKEPVKPKATKILNVHQELTEQDAIKNSISVIKVATVNGSSADLYDDHKRRLIASPVSGRFVSMDTDEASVAFNQALRQRHANGQWQTDRNNVADSVENVNRVVYHRNPEHPEDQSHSEVQRSSRRSSKASSSDSGDFGGVTINFRPVTKIEEMEDTSSNNYSTMHPTETTDVSPYDDYMTSVLPWQDDIDPSPTHLHDKPDNEPTLAHVPSWVNNLSYSPYNRDWLPYVSPQATVIAQATDYHKTVYSLFQNLAKVTGEGQETRDSETTESVDQNVLNENEVTIPTCDNFPIPWGQSVAEDCPLVSQMPLDSGTRSADYLQSAHSEQAPDHHHVIIPTHEYLQLDSNSNSSEHHAHLTEVASAPDFQHWKPITKQSFISEKDRMQSDTMLTEMAFVEGIKSRVCEWLKQADDDEENDADEESDEADGLLSADEIEKELDIAMSLGRKQ